MFEPESSVEITPKWRLVIGALLIFIFIDRFHDTFIRKRGYRKPIPEKEHYLITKANDVVKFVLRDGELRDTCVLKYPGLFIGNEIGDTLRYEYVYQGAFYVDDRSKAQALKDQEQVCQVGDIFKADFNLSSTNNQRLILNDLYRMEPP